MPPQAAKGLGLKIKAMLEANEKVVELRKFLDQIYNHDKDAFGQRINLKSLTEAVGGDLVDVDTLTRGTQNFHEAEVKPSMMLKLRSLPGQTLAWVNATWSAAFRCPTGSSFGTMTRRGASW